MRLRPPDYQTEAPRASSGPENIVAPICQNVIPTLKVVTMGSSADMVGLLHSGTSPDDQFDPFNPLNEGGLASSRLGSSSVTPSAEIRTSRASISTLKHTVIDKANYHPK